MAPDRPSLVFLSRTEAEAILSELDGPAGIVCRLAYLTGLKMTEVLRLRARDVDIGERNDVASGHPEVVGRPPPRTHLPEDARLS